ncbi:MAG: CocE/NonD family hydrolase [Bacteroidota bacterium]
MQTKLLTLTLLLFFSLQAFSQPLSPLIDSIPMRDGKKLAADIYIPTGTQQRPTILIQTPYNRIFYRYGLPIGTGININTSNYNFVIIDWRGFYGSVNAWVYSPNRGFDGYDAIDWIKDQSWSDGQIGTWGPSALGKVQYQTAKEKHPNHICAVPLVAASQFEYNEYFQGGVYRTEYVDQLDALGYGMSSMLLANPFYNYLWQYTENTNYYPADIEIPMLMIGGWYDHNTDLMLNLFTGLTQQSPAASQQKILIGPWAHGGFGMAYVGSALQGELYYYEAENYSDSLAWRFFNYHLLNINNQWDNTAKYSYFQMGENTWETSAIWPPAGLTNFNLYLSNSNSLESVFPQNSTGNSTLIYDPADPSPSYGGETLRQDLVQGPYDQSDTVEARNDILIFSTPVLLQNVVLKGKPIVHLFVSSDRKDTDFAIRLTDVYPDGRSMLVSEGIKRMRFRNGYTVNDTVSMLPGQIYEIEIELKNTAITFLSGHQIRIDITSSNYPRFDNNLNNGGTMYVAGDTLIAVNTIYHNSANASYIVFPFIDYVQNLSDNDIKNPSIKIFPNPSKESIYVIYKSDNACKGSMKILDITGRIQYNEIICISTGENTFFTNVSKLKPGNYILAIITDSHEIKQKLNIY